MSRLHMSLPVSASRESLAAVRTPVGGAGICRMEALVFVEVTRVAERARANSTPQWLVTCVRAQMYLQAVLARVQLAAVDT